MKHKGLKVISIILAFAVVFWVTVNLIPPKKNTESNPFIVGEGKLPLLAAHRGGGDNNPENRTVSMELDGEKLPYTLEIKSGVEIRQVSEEIP